MMFQQREEALGEPRRAGLLRSCHGCSRLPPGNANPGADTFTLLLSHFQGSARMETQTWSLELERLKQVGQDGFMNTGVCHEN